jgi:hypothetical protein
MYTPIACVAGMVLRINGKFTMGKICKGPPIECPKNSSKGLKPRDS